MKSVVIFIFICMLLNGIVADGSERGRVKGQAVKKATPCNKQNFDSLKSCCQGSVGAFFDVSEIKSCVLGSVDPKMKKFATYQLHTLFDANNNLDVGNAKNLKALGQVPLDANNKTKVDAASAIFEKVATSNWVAAGAPPAVNDPDNPALMAEIVSQCAIETSKFTPSRMDVTIGKTMTQNCLTEPALLLQCVRKTVAQFCPPSLVVTKNAATCTKSLNMLSTCGFFNTTITYRS